MGIVKSLFSRNGSREDEIHEEAPIEARASAQLFMLTPDAAGIAAYQVQTFSAVMTAELYLDSTMRGEVREGTILFWGMSWYPGHGDDGTIEPVVLIKDIRRSGQVYTFSFADLNSAYDFVRHEMKAGLDLAQVSIYWALPAKIAIDFWGRAGITPQEPPRRAPMRILRRPELLPEAHEVSPEPEFFANEPVAEIEVETLVEEAPTKRVPSNPALPSEISGSALDEADLAQVFRILNAKGVGPVSNGNGKAATVEPPAEPPAVAEPNEVKPIDDDTLNVQLSDVYGQPMRVVRRTNRDALSRLGDFGREHETPELFQAEGEPAIVQATVQEIKAPQAEEVVSGVVQAWDNITFALDRALDAWVAQRVVATITWRRLSFAIAQAAEASEAARSRAAWRNGADALAVAAQVVDAQQRAMLTAWRNSARALRKAAEVFSGQRAMRHAWLNISWTLEEGVYAYNLERKAQLIRSWAALSRAISLGAERKDALDRGMATAWRTASAEAYAAASAQEGRRIRVESAWSAVGDAVAEGVAAKFRHERLVFAWGNFGLAAGEGLEAKAYRDGMVTSWALITNAIEDACMASARHDGMVVAWRRLALETLVAADMQVTKEAAINAWVNVSFALFEAADARMKHDGLVSAWYSSAVALSDFALAQQYHEALVDAWGTLGTALLEAANAKIKHDSLVQAWRNAARAFRNAAQAYYVRQMSYMQSWQRIAEGIADAVQAKQTRDAAIAAWGSTAVALGEFVAAKRYHDMSVRAWQTFGHAVEQAMPHKLYQMAMIEYWNNATRALREATVAEAQLRIAQASLDEQLLKEVNAAITKVKGEKVAEAIIEATVEAPDLALVMEAAAAEAVTPVVADEMPTVKAEPKAAPRRSKGPKVSKNGTRKAKSGETEEAEKEAVKVAAKKKVAEAAPAVEVVEEEKVDGAAAMEMWRFRETSRFQAKDDDFKGFESPPGRF